MSDDAPTRLQLIREADGSRSRLLEVLGELENRRHQAFDMGLQVHRHRKLAIAAALVVGLGAVALSISSRLTAPRRRWRARWRLLRGAWLRPEDAVPVEHRSLGSRVLGAILVSIASTTASIVARRLLTRVLEAPSAPHHGGVAPASRA
jgi:hypothetical protein